MGGRVAGKAKIITNSAQLGLGLGLSLAKFRQVLVLYTEMVDFMLMVLAVWLSFINSSK